MRGRRLFSVTRLLRDIRRQRRRRGSPALFHIQPELSTPQTILTALTQSSHRPSPHIHCHAQAASLLGLLLQPSPRANPANPLPIGPPCAPRPASSSTTGTAISILSLSPSRNYTQNLTLPAPLLPGKHPPAPRAVAHTHPQHQSTSTHARPVLSHC